VERRQASLVVLRTIRPWFVGRNQDRLAETDVPQGPHGPGSPNQASRFEITCGDSNPALV